MRSSRAFLLLSVAVAVTLGQSAPGFTQARNAQAVAPIEGYACMQLARDAAHLRDPATIPPMLAAPSPGAPSLGVSPYIVIARSPARTINGYAEALWMGSTRDHPVTGWVPAGALLPFRSANAPAARCAPVWLANGHPGALTR